jgi:hypothetical protein
MCKLSFRRVSPFRLSLRLQAFKPMIEILNACATIQANHQNRIKQIVADRLPPRPENKAKV